MLHHPYRSRSALTLLVPLFFSCMVLRWHNLCRDEGGSWRSVPLAMSVSYLSLLLLHGCRTGSVEHFYSSDISKLHSAHDLSSLTLSTEQCSEHLPNPPCEKIIRPVASRRFRPRDPFYLKQMSGPTLSSPMQLSASQPRKQPGTFVNHTPRAHETITLVPASPARAEMPASPGLLDLSTESPQQPHTMGQASSASTRERGSRHPSPWILREDSVRVEEAEADEIPSRPDSWSMHHDCTDQAPYDMNTQDSLLRLPSENPSHYLAFFLRSTGPTAPHRQPSILSSSKPPNSSSKTALRFRKAREQSQVRASKIREAVGLPADLVPSSVEQRTSSSGQPYLALKVPEPGSVYKGGVKEQHQWPNVAAPQPQASSGDVAPQLSPVIAESRVSISFPESINSLDNPEAWKFSPERRPLDSIESTLPSGPRSVDSEKTLIFPVQDPSTPIRPRASNPPTPEPVSAISMADSYRSELPEHPAKRSFDICRALSSHPVHATSYSLPLAEVRPLQIGLPVQQANSERNMDIEHPAPRRIASHTVLLQRTTSVSSTSIDHPSMMESPGPPPPRSPLRPRGRTIEGILASYEDRSTTHGFAPSIRNPRIFDTEVQPIKPTVITDCTGPIKRPKSREKGSGMPYAYRNLRKQREERTRARKLRDRPRSSTPISIIDAIIHAPPPAARQKLRKVRPRIQIPSLKPAQLARRTSSSASSNGSWQRVTQITRTPISPASSQNKLAASIDKTGYTPISPATSNASANVGSVMSFSPLMLVAEEVPVPKTRYPQKPAKVIVREGKAYTPRPRSASIPRSAMKRRSRVGGSRTPSRPNSPAPPPQDNDPPPLPSPPPNRALPPTPPVSGSEKAGKSRSIRAAETKKELPSLPTNEIAANISVSRRRPNHTPHIVTQRKSVAPGETAKDSIPELTVQGRLDALEQQNALLSARLAAVYGALHSSLADPGECAPLNHAMSWESRIARRSAASHAASSSNGSTLDMYLSTRHGSKRGR